MRNSFFLLLAVACVFTQVQAEESVDTSRDLSGFYVGFDLSHDWSTARNYSDYGKATVTTTPAGGGESKVSDDEYFDIGFSKHKRAKLDPVISLGYSRKFGNGFLVGVSAEAAFGKSKDGQNNDFIKHVEEGKIRGCSYALKVKGGYYLSSVKASVYGIAGLKWKKSDFRVVKNSEDQDPEVNAITPGKVMPVLGVGVEKKLAERLSCSLEYECSWRRSGPVYQAANPGAEDHTNEAGNNVAVKSLSQFCRSSLHSNSVRIGLKYYLF